MIDLDFLSTSSSDSVGLSGAGTAHISDFTTSEIKKEEVSVKQDHGWQYLHAHTGFAMEMFCR